LTDEMTQKNSSEEDRVAHGPRAVSVKRVKKGNEAYRSYGNFDNYRLMMDYGFGLVLNKADKVSIGWGLVDAVGNVSAPESYEAPFSKDNTDVTATKGKGVFESSDSATTNSWWTSDRLGLLLREAFLNESHQNALTSGKRILLDACFSGEYNSVLLKAAVVSTMKPSRVGKEAKNPESGKRGIIISKSHQQLIREYLIFYLTRKLEALLHGLNSGLKIHYSDIDLWTKASQGGIHYKGSKNDNCFGWQTFFDMYAYSSISIVEKRYYALGPDSCVLVLYDGYLRALDSSLDGLSDEEKFENGVLQELRDLGYVLAEDDNVPGEEEQEEEKVIEEKVKEEKVKEEKIEKVVEQEVISQPNVTTQPKVSENESATNPAESDTCAAIVNGELNGKSHTESDSKTKGNRKKGRKKGNGGNGGGGEDGERSRAIKLHIGNLAYCTLASDLFDYFASIYGRASILECHIPTERDSTRSRGFGFITMPEQVSLSALKSGRKHEVHGRTLKVSESNSSGSAVRKGPSVNAVASTDRCARCGYSPRYCKCKVPDIPAFNGTGRDAPRPPEPGPFQREPDLDYYGASYRRERERQSFSASPGRLRERYRDPREYDRGYRRSRSRSYSRGMRERRRDRERDYSRERDRYHRDRHKDRSVSRERSRDRRSGRNSWDGRRSARYSSRSRSRSYSRDRSGSRSRRRDRDRDRDRNRDSPGIDRSDGAGGKTTLDSASPKRSERKRESGRKRSRSRSSGRRSRRKKSSRKESRKEERRSHSRSRSGHEEQSDT